MPRARLPLARAFAISRWSRLMKSSCFTNLVKYSSPFISQKKDHKDCPAPGVLGSSRAILPFHFGFKRSSNERKSFALARSELYQREPVPASAINEYKKRLVRMLSSHTCPPHQYFASLTSGRIR